jgi:superoxide dismutase, Cu-Zn family
MRKIGLVAALPLLLAGCQSERADENTLRTPQTTADTAPIGQQQEAPVSGMVVLLSPEGDTVGQATLREHAGQGVVIDLDARNLPAGERAIHFHAVGQCDPPSFASAGPHFAPMDRSHGFDHPEGPHAGDMRNVQIGGDGTLRTRIINDRVTLRRGEQNSLLDSDGTALVIHAAADDYVSQPSGNAGDRIACGVVTEGAS